jgi:hypothetical protein
MRGMKGREPTKFESRCPTLDASGPCHNSRDFRFLPWLCGNDVSRPLLEADDHALWTAKVLRSRCFETCLTHPI